MSAKMTLLAVAGRDYALPVDCIRHILAEVPVFPLVRLRAGFSGVFLFEGEIIPLLEPSMVPGIDGERVCAAPYVVICQSDYGGVGVPVERAVRIVETQEGSVSPAPPGTEPALVSQIFLWRGHPYPMLDVDTLLAQLSYQ